MKIQDLLESEDKKPDLMTIFRAFLPVAIKELDLKTLPKIKLHLHLDSDDQPSFGRFQNNTSVIDLAIEDRHPLDILRTLAHELVHYKQNEEVGLGPDSGNTGSPEENEAHELAGIVMRNFNKEHPEFFQTDAINLEETIRKVKGGYRLVSHSGKNLGTYPSKGGAEKRERQVQYFKHNK